MGFVYTVGGYLIYSLLVGFTGLDMFFLCKVSSGKVSIGLVV